MEKAVDGATLVATPPAWGVTHKMTKERGELPYFREDAISLYQLDVFAQVLDAHVQNFCSQFGVHYGSYVRSSWFSVFDEHSYGHVHNHVPADISGCYYVETSGDDGSIFFLSPAPAMATSRLFTDTHKPIVVKPEVGKLLMFPGFLDHGVQTNKTKNRRISLAFNITFDPWQWGEKQ
jgi:uncharacterized protein (TIGR02466 family)